MPNKKLPLVFDAAVLDDPDGWLDDEHITAAQHLLQEQMWQACKVHHWSTPEHLMFTKTTHSRGGYRNSGRGGSDMNN